MKKIYFIFLCFCILTFMVSCDKSFLNTEPTSSLSRETLKKTPEGIQGVLEGIHNMFYMYSFGQGFGNGAASLNTQLDFLGNSLINSLPAIYMGGYRWEDHRNPNGTINYKAWDYYYTLIQHCNTVLEMSNGLADIDPKQLNTFMGEAHVIRAYCYANLTQLFGKRYVKGGDNSSLGVILRLEPNIDPIPRSTVEECYVQINKDIEEGLKQLSAGVENNRKNRITLPTAYGIAARAALAQQDYPKAGEYAAKAIEYFKGKLQADNALLDGFNNYEATEWMWGYRQATDQSMGYAAYGAHYAYNFTSNRVGSLKFAVNRSYYDKMGEKDIRRKWFVALDRGDKIPEDAAAVYFNGGTKNPKWETTGQSIKFRTSVQGISSMDNCIMRLGEMYYILAESQARQGNVTVAVKTLEAVMITRDPEYKVPSSLSQEQLANEVLRNKKIDLYFEGVDFFDMKRLGQIPDRTASGNDKYMTAAQAATFKIRNTGDNVKGLPKDADDKVWQFVIPYQEIKGNKLCEQNPL